jgi:nucleoside-diphosphate-sugar epimerase
VNKMLVAGASGLIGLATVRHFAALDGWEVAGVSRRVPAGAGGATVVPLDLTDLAACRSFAAAHPDVTHLAYAALFELPGLMPGWFDEDAIERNTLMLRNLCAALAESAPGLRHVSLMHGTKAYGVHTGIAVTPEMVPLRERLPRIPHRNFYFTQEEYLRREHRDWELTVFRPTVVYGQAAGNNMNPLLPVLAYAAVLRERGEPLYRPWPAEGPWRLSEAVDADLVAQAVAWAATSDAARGETFNLTNGDVFTWDGVWPAIAGALGMKPGGHRPVSFVRDVRGWAGEWAAIVDRYDLAAPRELDAFTGYNSLVYADQIVAGARRSAAVPLLNSTVKARLAGFGACADTEDMFRRQIAGLQRARMIPGREAA